MGKEGVYKDVMGAMKKHADIEHVQMHGSRYDLHARVRLARPVPSVAADRCRVR